jgi:hypothetical protein
MGVCGGDVGGVKDEDGVCRGRQTRDDGRSEIGLLSNGESDSREGPKAG